MALSAFLFAVGLFIIVKSADIFVSSASRIAEQAKVPKFIIGATLISIATSLPELFVAVFASLKDVPEIAVGTSIGSVTANICIMMSLSFIYMPSFFKRKDYLFEGIIMLLSAFILLYCGMKNGIDLVEIIILLLMFAIFIAQNIKSAYENTVPDIFKVAENEQVNPKRDLTIDFIKFALSSFAMVIGSRLLIDNGDELASYLGVTHRVISTTVIAIATSLPEMVTAITAFSKKQSTISMGNIVGANIIDLTLILPVSAILSGGHLPFSREVVVIDILILLAVTVICIVPSLIKGKFMRWQGAVLLSVYGAYFLITCGFITV